MESSSQSLNPIFYHDTECLQGVEEYGTRIGAPNAHSDIVDVVDQTGYQEGAEYTGIPRKQSASRDLED